MNFCIFRKTRVGWATLICEACNMTSSILKIGVYKLIITGRIRIQSNFRIFREIRVRWQTSICKACFENTMKFTTGEESV